MRNGRDIGCLEFLGGVGGGGGFRCITVFSLAEAEAVTKKNVSESCQLGCNRFPGLDAPNKWVFAICEICVILRYETVLDFFLVWTS